MYNKTAHSFESPLLALDFHSATAQIANSRNAVPAFTVSFPDPGPQSCSFSSPFQTFPQSLSLRQVSHSPARKEADVPNPKILTKPLCILSAWNLQVSKQGLPHGASPFKHLNTNQPANTQTTKPKIQHTSPLPDSGIYTRFGFKILYYLVS